MTPRELVAQLAAGLDEGPTRCYYAVLEDSFFYFIRHAPDGHWHATPISDERHDLLLSLTRAGRLQADTPVTVVYPSGYTAEAKTLRPVT